MENMQWINYQYQLLRYRHDHLSGEFVNLGIVFFDPQAVKLIWRFEDRKYGRVSQFFGDSVQGSLLLSSLKQLGKSLEKLQNDGAVAQFGDVEALTTFILPPDDNGLYFSESWQGRHIDHQLAFDELYERIIGKYQEDPISRHDDAYAWKKVYKQYFDKYDITPKLKPHKINTQTDSFDFKYTCKNGAWHCIQSLSFALKNEGSIKEKIYRWDGISRELLTAGEPVKVYLLSILPDNPELVELIKRKLNQHNNDVEVRLVGERDADAFARELKRNLEAPH